MKILIISARYYPEPFSITRIAEGLAKLGNDITVLTGRPNYGQWKIYDGYKKVGQEVINGVKVVRVKEKARKKGLFGLLANYFSIHFLYKQALKKSRGDFDVVLAHVLSPIFTISFLSRYCKKHNLPSVLYGFDLWPESLIASGYLKANSPLIKLLKKYCARIYNSLDMITFASPSAKSYFTDYLGVRTPFRHIFQPCLTNMPPIESVNNHDFVEHEKINILFCGTVAKFNHLDLFVEAMDDEIIKKNIHFDIVGSGSDLDCIKKCVEKLHLEETIAFHGRVPAAKTINYYLSSDVLFVPLYCNSATSLMIPQKLIEYLMYSRPIIGMIKGDGEELLRQASKYNIIADQTVHSIRNCLFELINRKRTSFAEWGAQNRHFYENNKRFSLEAVCNELNETLIGVVAEDRK